MEKNIETYLPVFPGFYETGFDLDHQVEQETKNWFEDVLGYNPEHLSSTDELFETDWEQIHLDVAKACVEVIGDTIVYGINFPGLQTLKFQSLKSPREYNFMNDSIDIVACFSDYEEFRIWFLDFITKHDEAWAKFLKDRYTSYSGFMSSYPNTPEAWDNDTKCFRETDGHYLGTLFEFIFQVEGYTYEWLREEAHEEVRENEYVSALIPPRGELPAPVLAELESLEKALDNSADQLFRYISVRPEKATEATSTVNKEEKKIREEIYTLLKEQAA